jgi:hypothetical protein
MSQTRSAGAVSRFVSRTVHRELSAVGDGLGVSIGDMSGGIVGNGVPGVGVITGSSLLTGVRLGVGFGLRPTVVLSLHPANAITLKMIRIVFT